MEEHAADARVGQPAPATPQIGTHPAASQLEALIQRRSGMDLREMMRLQLNEHWRMVYSFVTQLPEQR